MGKNIFLWTLNWPYGEKNAIWSYFLRSVVRLINNRSPGISCFFCYHLYCIYKSVYLICYWESWVAPYGNPTRSGKILFRRSLFPSGLSTCLIHSLIFWWSRQDKIVLMCVCFSSSSDKCEEIQWHVHHQLSIANEIVKEVISLSIVRIKIK